MNNLDLADRLRSLAYDVERGKPASLDILRELLPCVRTQDFGDGTAGIVIDYPDGCPRDTQVAIVSLDDDIFTCAPC